MEKHVLVADDQPELRQVVCLFLEMFFHAKTYQVADGQEGLEFLSNNKVDLIITDLDMPVLNGLDMVKAIRAQRSFAATPIFMITSEGEEYRQKALDIGVTNFFNKPMAPESLTPAIEEYLLRK